jgi:hypothetical protein
LGVELIEDDELDELGERRVERISVQWRANNCSVGRALLGGVESQLLQRTTRSPNMTFDRDLRQQSGSSLRARGIANSAVKRSGY